jgi:uncharacterized protein (TIGR02271 family)
MNRISDLNQQPEFEQERTDNLKTGEAAVIPIIEEQWQVGKKIVETGRVVVSKKVHEEEVTVDVPIMHEEHDIERVTVNQYVDTAPPAVRYEGETMIIPVLREEVIVEKRILLVEELRITKRQIQTNTPQQVTLRKEEVIVDRTSNDNINQDPV